MAVVAPSFAFQTDGEFIPPSEFVFKNWSLKEGLPQNSVNDIIQTRDGYIWLATWGGLVRFDGVKFTVFNQAAYPEMLSDRVLKIYEDQSSTLWIATEEHLISKHKNTFTVHSGKNGLPSKIVNLIGEEPDGRLVIINSHTALFYHEEGQWKKEVYNVQFLPGTFYIFLDDGLYAISQQHIFKKNPSGWKITYTYPEPLKSRVTSFLQDKKGDFWIGTNGHGVFLLSNGNFSSIGKNDGVVSEFISNLFEDSVGNIWILTLSGISLWDGEKFTSITDQNGLSDLRTRLILEDHEGTFWLGTETAGLDKIRRSIFQVYGKKQGVAVENLLSVTATKNNTILFGSNCDGFYEFTQGRIFRRTESDLLKNECVWSVLEDENGNIWTGSNGLASVKKDGTVRHFHEGDGLNDTNVRALFIDTDQSLWIGSSGGLNHFKDQKMTSYTTENGLSHNDVRSVYRDSRNNLWIGTTQGLNKMSGKTTISFNSIPELSSHYVRAIYEDVDGNLWFGTYGDGLVVLKEEVFTAITKQDGLFDNIVSHIVEDASGYFWMGSNRGISRVSRKNLLDYASGKTGTIRSTFFGIEQGLINPETNGGFQPSSATLADGRIFFPTVAGLAVVDPKNVHSNTIAPSVHLENVLLNNNLIQYEDSVTADWRVDMLEINYTALSFVDPALVNFRYKLQNYDEDWIEAGNRRTAFYTGLPPGKYTFMVTASNNDGVWSKQASMLPITIVPPFWMTRWFTFFMAFMLAIGGIALYVKRINKLKRERDRQEEVSTLLIEKQEEERTRIAGEMHDSLGQLLLVMKNRALQQIRKESTDPASKDLLENISDDVSRTLKTVREISHNLRPPELDRLGITETIRAQLDDISKSVAFSIHSEIESIDGLIPKEKEINFIRIVQEAFSNIIKHAEASHVEIRLSVKSNNIILTIRDNGRGFDSQNSGANQIGLGFTTLSERVRILRGTYNLDSYPGKGTFIVVNIPVH